MSADSTGRVQALQAAREEARDALQQQALKHAQVCVCVRACVFHSNMCLGVTPIHVLIKGENELLESKVKTLKGQQQMNGELRRQLAIMQVCVCVRARAFVDGVLFFCVTLCVYNTGTIAGHKRRPASTICRGA